MVDCQIITIILSLVSAIIGGILAFAGTYYSEQNAAKRLRSKFLLDKKVDALTELYTELDDCHDILRRNMREAQAGKYTNSDFQENVIPAMRSFRERLEWTKIYLNEEKQIPILEDTLAIFEDSEKYIARLSEQEQYSENAIEQSRVSFDELDSAKSETLSMLKEELDVELNK
jgi:hypothetical protein